MIDCSSLVNSRRPHLSSDVSTSPHRPCFASAPSGAREPGRPTCASVDRAADDEGKVEESKCRWMSCTRDGDGRTKGGISGVNCLFLFLW